jgi:hypothetical protein
MLAAVAGLVPVPVAYAIPGESMAALSTFMPVC